jgi:hypothetical protein
MNVVALKQDKRPNNQGPIEANTKNTETPDDGRSCNRCRRHDTGRAVVESLGPWHRIGHFGTGMGELGNGRRD